MVGGQAGVLNRHATQMMRHRGIDGSYGVWLDMRNVVIPLASGVPVGLS